MANFLQCVGGRLLNLDQVSMIHTFRYPADRNRTILDKRLMDELDINDEGESCVYAKMRDGNHYVIESFDPGQEVEPKNAEEALDHYADIINAGGKGKPRIIVYSNNGLVEYVMTDLHTPVDVVIIRDEDNCSTKIHAGSQSHTLVGLEDTLEMFDKGGGSFTFTRQGWHYISTYLREGHDEDDNDMACKIGANIGEGESGVNPKHPVTIHFDPNDYLRIHDIADRSDIEEVDPNG